MGTIQLSGRSSNVTNSRTSPVVLQGIINSQCRSDLKLKCWALGMLALVVLFSTSLSAAESSKISLPDGLYLYDSWIEKLSIGSKSVRFEKYFVVKSNVIYSSNESIKKFGSTKLNKLFTENKRYKILLGGNKVGEIYDVTFDTDGDWNYKEKLFTENIKEGPMYGRKSIYLGRLGSALKCIAVPENYKGIKKKFNTLSKKETDRIAILVKDNLFCLMKKRKEIKQYKLKYTELNEEYLELLDKTSDHRGDYYIGVYRYIFKLTQENRSIVLATTVPSVEIAFSITNDTVHVITSDYESGEMKICGMLDVDCCGVDELIIEKDYSDLDNNFIEIEIYKQNIDGNWARIR